MDRRRGLKETIDGVQEFPAEEPGCGKIAAERRKHRVLEAIFRCFGLQSLGMAVTAAGIVQVLIQLIIMISF